jgi:hypothetical protein
MSPHVNGLKRFYGLADQPGTQQTPASKLHNTKNLAQQASETIGDKLDEVDGFEAKLKCNF